jgi:hypothetical protein
LAVSGIDVDSAHDHVNRIPWKFALPLLMGIVTTGLYYLEISWGHHPGYGGAFDAFAFGTAQGIAALINGPGALFIMNLTGQLVGVAIFWTWTGFLVDRRLRGFRQPLIKTPWLRSALYLLGLVLACWSFWSVAKYLLYAETLKYLARMPSIFLSNSPARFVLGRDLWLLARLVWGFGYSIYFLNKLWSLRTDRSSAAAV